MIAPNRNTLWATIFVDELARTGLKAVCIAPGSRSTPLTLAFSDHPDIKVYSLLDERGAGFFALGMALAGGAPVALVCTSGTATANFHPAIIEAYYAQVPLLVLTGDRPHELRDSGANQTIDQIKMYGDHVRWFVDVAPPEANPPATTLRYLRTLACRAFAVAAGPTAGPVHLNFPFRKPLEPTLVSGDVPAHLEQDNIAFNGRPNGEPFTHIARGHLVPDAEQVNLLVEAIQNAERGLIICGPRCPTKSFPEAVTRLAKISGYPIFADALSGVRFGLHKNDDTHILSGYETFLQPDVIAGLDTPDLILHFGVTPTSKALGDYLASIPECRRIAINGSGSWHDDTHTISDLIWADPTTTCELVTKRLEAEEMTPRRDVAWLEVLRNLEVQSWQSFDSKRAKTFFEGIILADIVESITEEAVLYVASSLPVRHLDQFARSSQATLRVFANRGASGIDGTISSALGAAAAMGLPLVLVTGDLAFYHDLNGLLALRRCGVKATIVLINNDGGGIFHRLPIANFDPPFTDLFITPHGLQFESVARMFGTDYKRVTKPKDFRSVFKDAIGSDTSQIIEVFTDSTLHEKIRREIAREVTQQITTAIN